MVFAGDHFEFLLNGEDGFNRRQVAQNIEGLEAELVADTGNDCLFGPANDAGW
jgi:hypothetical protein